MEQYAEQIASSNPEQRFKGYLGRGSAYRDLREYDKAIADLKQAIELGPENWLPYMYLGFCYGSTGRLVEANIAMGWSDYYGGTADRAIQRFSDALRREPRSVEAMVGRGRANIAYGQAPAGLEDLERAIQMDPQWAPAYAARGTYRLNTGDYPAAIEDFDRALALSPENHLARFHRGQALMATEQPAQAARDLALLVQQYPVRVDYRLALGRARLASGAFEQALIVYDALIHQQPRNPVAWSQRAHALARLGRPGDALESADRAIQIDDANAAALFIRGMLKVNAGDAETALDDLTRAVRFEPTFAQVAVRVFDRVIKRDPKSYNAYHGRAIVHYQQKQYKQALADLDQVMALTTATPRMASYDYGLTLQRLGRHRAAIAYFNDAILGHGSLLASAWLGRGRSYAALGEHEKAIHDYVEVIDSELKAEARKHLASEYAAAGRTAEALDVLRPLTGEGDHEVLYMRALLLAESGDKAAANKALREASRLSPLEPLYRKYFSTRSILDTRFSAKQLAGLFVAYVGVILVANVVCADDIPPPSSTDLLQQNQDRMNGIINATAEGLAAENTKNF